MNPETILSLISIAAQYEPVVQKMLNGGLSLKNITTQLPTLAPLIEQFGAWVFPSSSASTHAVLGVVAYFDHAKTEWRQGKLNKAMPDYKQLQVDGAFGPATRDAVKEFQKRKNLQVDGYPGPLADAALAVI